MLLQVPWSCIFSLVLPHQCNILIHNLQHSNWQFHHKLCCCSFSISPWFLDSKKCDRKVISWATMVEPYRWGWNQPLGLRVKKSKCMLCKYPAIFIIIYWIAFKLNHSVFFTKLCSKSWYLHAHHNTQKPRIARSQYSRRAFTRSDWD